MAPHKAPYTTYCKKKITRIYRKKNYTTRRFFCTRLTFFTPGMHWKGGGYPPPPPPSTQPTPSHCLRRQVPASMAFVTDSNRPQPLQQPPPTACPTGSVAASEVPSLLTLPRPPPPPLEAFVNPPPPSRAQWADNQPTDLRVEDSLLKGGTCTYTRKYQPAYPRSIDGTHPRGSATVNSAGDSASWPKPSPHPPQVLHPFPFRTPCLSGASDPRRPQEGRLRRPHTPPHFPRAARPPSTATAVGSWPSPHAPCPRQPSASRTPPQCRVWPVCRSGLRRGVWEGRSGWAWGRVRIDPQRQGLTCCSLASTWIPCGCNGFWPLVCHHTHGTPHSGQFPCGRPRSEHPCDAIHVCFVSYANDPDPASVPL